MNEKKVLGSTELLKYMQMKLRKQQLGNYKSITGANRKHSKEKRNGLKKKICFIKRS